MAVLEQTHRNVWQEAPSAHWFRPSCAGIPLSWPAAQTLDPREILEASGIFGRTPLPLTAPRACATRSQSCREVGSNRVRHARRSYPRARLEQRTCRQRPPHSGQGCCALRSSRGRNQSILHAPPYSLTSDQTCWFRECMPDYVAVSSPRVIEIRKIQALRA